MRDDGPTVREITTAVYVVPTGAVDMMARLAALFPGLVRSHYLGLRAPGRRSRPRHRVGRRPVWPHICFDLSRDRRGTAGRLVVIAALTLT